MDLLKSSSVIAQQPRTNPKMILDTIPTEGSNKYNNGIYINLGNKSLSKHRCDYNKHKHSQYSANITFNGKSIFTGSLCPNDDYKRRMHIY
jgi:hypothetical protein